MMTTATQTECSHQHPSETTEHREDAVDQQTQTEPCILETTSHHGPDEIQADGPSTPVALDAPTPEASNAACTDTATSHEQEPAESTEHGHTEETAAVQQGIAATEPAATAPLSCTTPTEFAPHEFIAPLVAWTRLRMQTYVSISNPHIRLRGPQAREMMEQLEEATIQEEARLAPLRHLYVDIARLRNLSDLNHDDEMEIMFMYGRRRPTEEPCLDVETRRQSILRKLFSGITIEEHTRVHMNIVKGNIKIYTFPHSEWSLWEAIANCTYLSQDSGYLVERKMAYLANSSNPATIRMICGSGPTAHNDWSRLGGGKIIPEGKFEPILVLLAEAYLGIKIYVARFDNAGNRIDEDLTHSTLRQNTRQVVLIPTIDPRFLQATGAIEHLTAPEALNLATPEVWRSTGNMRLPDLSRRPSEPLIYATTHFHAVEPKVDDDVKPLKRKWRDSTSGLPVSDQVWSFGRELSKVDIEALQSLTLPNNIATTEWPALILQRQEELRIQQTPVRTTAATHLRNDRGKMHTFEENYTAQVTRVQEKLMALYKDASTRTDTHEPDAPVSLYDEERHTVLDGYDRNEKLVFTPIDLSLIHI